MMSDDEAEKPVTKAVIELVPNTNKKKMETDELANDEETEMTTRESRLLETSGAANENKFQSEITNFMITTKSKPISQSDPSVLSMDSMIGNPVKPSTSVAKTEDSSQQDTEDITGTTARISKVETIKILEEVHSDQIAKKMSRGSSRASLNSRAYKALKDLTCCGTKLECTSEENMHYSRDPGI